VSLTTVWEAGPPETGWRPVLVDTGSAPKAPQPLSSADLDGGPGRRGDHAGF
jgi:hypothetical protein